MAKEVDLNIFKMHAQDAFKNLLPFQLMYSTDIEKERAFLKVVQLTGELSKQFDIIDPNWSEGL